MGRGLVMPATDSLVEVDMLKRLRFPCHGVGICHTSTALRLMTVKELDLNLTLGLAKRRKNETQPLEESWGGG